MTIDTFLFLLFVFSTLTGIVVEALKKLLTEKKIKFSCNDMAFGVALVIGVVGTILYYHFNNLPLDNDAFIFSVLMGVASALTSMTSYDKIKQAIEQMKR